MSPGLLEQVITVGLFASMIEVTVPLLLPALGELVSQKAGFMNVGLEGIMSVSAFVAFFAAHIFNNDLLVSTLLAVGVGIAAGLLMSLLCIYLKINQFVIGLAVTIGGGSLATFLNIMLFKTLYLPIQASPKLPIPILSDIPIIGEILFNQHIQTYFLFFILLPFVWFLINKTTAGLKIRAVGENPKAADSLGISPTRVRFLCLTFCCALAGLAGAFLTTATNNIFFSGMVYGRGWIAIALVIFGAWSSMKVFGGALLFGFIMALQYKLQAIGVAIPFQFLIMMPYVMTVAVLIFSRKRVPPGSLGVNFERIR